jgi:anti-anti-sigma factor
VSLAIATRKEGTIAIIHARGAVTLGPSLRAFNHRARRSLIEPGCTGLVMNLADVTAIDSAGIGALITIHSSASRHKIPVILVRPSARVREVLSITRVDALFRFAVDEHAAIDDLR